MAHARQQIRDAFVTTVTGLTLTGSNVYNHRAYPIASTNLPALRIRTNESAEQDTDLSDDVVSVRSLEIMVDILVRATTGGIDDIDDISVDVEEAIGADETLGGVADWCRIQSCEVDISEDAEATTMQGTLTFVARYRVDNSDVETILT